MRYLLGALLIIVALSMCTYLIPGGGMTGGGSAGDNVVAEVGDAQITTRDVQAQMEQILRGGRIPPEMAQVYVPQIIDQMISDQAVAYEAKRLGLNVSNSELAEAIRATPSFQPLFASGQFNKQAYENYLAQQGLTIPEFEANFKKQMLKTYLDNIALNGIVVTPADVEAAYKKKNEKLKVEYVSFSADKFKGQVKPSAEELKAYFNSHRNLFTVPEKRGFDIVLADEANVGQSIQVPEAALRRYYDTNLDKYRTPERVKARHILFMTQGKPPADLPKIRAKAEDVLKQVKNGGDFAGLAKKYSDDTASAVKGGDLGWVVRGQTVKAFEDAAFSMKPNQISNLVTTEYGFHIIQVLEKQPAHVQTFDEVKSQIAADIKREQVFDKMPQIADQARASLVKAPQQAAEIAKQDNLSFVHVDKAGTGDPLPQVGASPELLSAVMSLKKGEVSQVVQLSGNRLCIAVVTDVYPAHPAEFSDVEAQVRERYVTDKSNELVQAKLKEAAAKFTAGGCAQFEQVA
ncbi:MAG: peptidylprolyl isomerase, partial [Bryobacteraceae bacterium]